MRLFNNMKILLLSALLTITCSAAWAQQITVKGVVKDDDTGETLPAVTIMEKGTSNGTVTDFDGNYVLTVESSSTLVFSYIGFETKEVLVNGQTKLDVSLDMAISELNEIVVIGYGTQTKKVATAAVSKLDSKDIEGFAVPNVGNTLQGQISGVVMKSASGQAGTTPNIMIRGIGTNGDNNPLVIIDGLIFDNVNVLGGLNPSDIESINVLKDGASTAIYGSRGANGVIIVTTKRGTSEGTIEYNYSIGVQNAWKLPEVLNAKQYQEIITEKYANSGRTAPAEVTNPTCATCNTDWIGSLFEKGSVETHNFSYSKGTAQSSFRGSFSLYDQKGIIAPDKSNYKRGTFRINSEQSLNDYLKVGLNLTYVHTERQTIEENNSFGGPIATAIVYDPLTPIYDANAQFGYAQSKLVRKEYINPFSRIFLDNDKNWLDEVYGNSYLEFKPIKNVTVKSDIAVTKQYNRWGGYTPSYTALHPDDNGNLTNDVWAGQSEYGRWKWENTIRFDKTWKKHKVDVLVGQSRQADAGLGLSASGQNLNEDRFTEAWRFIGEAPDTLERANNWKNTRYAVSSIFGRLIYSFDDKYLFTAILRRDGSTRFGEENRYGVFPSVSAGWVVTSEDFWRVSVVNFLKVRASYGENGSDRIGDNRYRSVISGGPNYQFGIPGSDAIYYGFTTPYAANPLLHWETSKQIDFGFEAGLFEDLVTVEFDYYQKITSDLLLDGNPPLYSGTGAPVVNVGEFKNSGIELNLGLQKRVGEWNLKTTVTATTLKNKVTKLDGETSFISGYTWPVRNLAITGMEVGKPVGYFRGYKTEGIFRSQAEVFSHIGPNGDPLQPNAKPGDLIFVDANNDGVLNTEDMVQIGKPWADLTLGWQLSASYRGLSLSAVLFASLGSEIYRTYERQDVTNNNYQTFWLDRWSESNPNGKYPRLVTDDLNGNQRPSDFYVESGNFLRVKNVQIGYTIPSKLTQKAKVKNLKVFASVDNLMTLTGYKGFDPEIGTSGWILDTGVDKGFYPLSRTISGGFSIQF